MGASSSSADPACLRFEDSKCGVDRSIMGGAHLMAYLVGTKGKQKGDRLRRVECAVEAGHSFRSLSGNQRCSAAVPAAENVLEICAVDSPGEAEEFRAVADPSAGRLARAEVILLGSLGDGVEVVVSPARAELTDAQHGKLSGPDSPARADGSTDGASASLINGMSTGRSAEAVMTLPGTATPGRC